MMFPICHGINCTYSTTLAVSGAGAFFFTFESPFLYVTDEGTGGDSVLTIYDCSVMSTPVLVSTTDLAFAHSDLYARCPRVYGDTLYIPCNGNGFAGTGYVQIWDVSDRANPAFLGEFQTVNFDPFGPMALSLIGSELIVGSNGFAKAKTFYFLDVSDPTAPVSAGTLNPHSPFVSSCQDIIECRGKWLAVGQITGGASQPEVWAINPSAHTVASSDNIGTASSPPGFITLDEPDGDHAYFQSETALWHVDVSDLAAIDVTGFTATGGGVTGGAGPICAIANINRLYFGQPSGAGLAIYIHDISDRDTPAEVGSISTAGETTTCIKEITDGCSGLAWGQGTGAAIHLVGEPPLS